MTALKRITPKLFVSPMVIFAILMFFICLADALMSYISPIYIEKYSAGPFVMGLILSTSSIVGVFFDVFISQRQWRRDYNFFIKVTLYTAVLFPLSFLLLPPHFSTFLIGMFIWGAYYEYKGFSYYNFIDKFQSKDQHTSSWGLLTAFTSFAYAIGPAIAANITGLGYKTTFLIALIPLVLAIITYKLFSKMFKSNLSFSSKHVKESKKGFLTEMTILKVLLARVWPLVVFSFLLILVDSCFWTIGTLLTEQLKETSYIGSLFLTAYMLPPLFAGIFANKFSVEFGKKRTAFLNALVAAIFLVAMGTTKSVPLIILYTFIMSIFLTIANILVSAVIEDYFKRLNKYASDMVTIEQVSGSFAYIVGPILMGFIAQIVGYTETFAITGVVLGVVAFFCFFAVPRKIKMPQAALQGITID